MSLTALLLACGADAPAAHEPKPEAAGEDAGKEGATVPNLDPVPITGNDEALTTPDVGGRDVGDDSDDVNSPDVGGPAVDTSTRGPWPLAEDAQLERLALAEDIVKRLPVGETDAFEKGHKVQLFIEASNRSGEEHVISVAWENTATGRRSPATEVRIGKGRIYRTRAYRTMRRAGDYRAVVMNAAGDEIAELPFRVLDESP